MGQLAPGMVRSWHARVARSHPSTAAKAYRLLRTICNTAVLDEVIARSPCRVEGAGTEHAEERPIATLEEIEVIVKAMPARFKALALLATWCQLRKGELCALRRRDIDPTKVHAHRRPEPPAAPRRTARHQRAKVRGRAAHRGDPIPGAPGPRRASGDLHRSGE
jgi:integrase